MQLTLWALPPVTAWLALAPYSPRLLAPAWPPLAILVACVIVGAMRGHEVRRHRLRAALAPIALCAVALHGAFNLANFSPAVWLRLAAHAGPDRDALEARAGIVQGPFASARSRVAEAIGPGGSVVSPDGRFRYDFPGRAKQTYPTGCGDLTAGDVFVLPLSQNVRKYFREQLGVPDDPAHWDGCVSPRLERISEDEAYVVFRVLPD